MHMACTLCMVQEVFLLRCLERHLCHSPRCQIGYNPLTSSLLHFCCRAPQPPLQFRIWSESKFHFTSEHLCTLMTLPYCRISSITPSHAKYYALLCREMAVQPKCKQVLHHGLWRVSPFKNSSKTLKGMALKK